MMQHNRESMAGARFWKRYLWLMLVCFGALVSGGAQGGTFSDVPPDFTPISTETPHYGLFLEKEATLRAKLLAAEILSVNIDIESYKKEIDTAKGEARQQDILAMEKRISTLNSALEKLSSTDPAHYVLPIKRRISVRPTTVYGIGSVLERDDQKSGNAIYRVVGIQGDDFSLLEPGRWYSLEVYILRARDASVPIPEYYVYVMAPSEPGPGFSAPDEGAQLPGKP